jgi:hypothetical protein
MAGFTSNDNMISNVSASGKQYSAPFTKQFNPTAAAVANEWHTLFRGGGQPQADAIFDVGTNLQFQSVYDVTTSAGCIQHGGNIGATGADFKTLMSAYAVTAASTVVPFTIQLVDVLAFIRVTTVTTTTAQSVVASNTFTASSSSGLLLTYTNDWSNYQKVQFTTTGTLPTGLSLATDYWLVRQSATTAKVATTYANALAGTVVAFTDAGTGTHTLTCRLPRYSDGAGVQAMFFNPAATALGAGTPNLTLGYTNSAGTASRATPTSPSAPIGKTAASNSHILYSGATGAGKFGPSIPLAASDAGIRSIQTIQNSTSYVSGSYTVALYVPLGEIPLQVLGQPTFMDFTQAMYPSFPRVYDGAALYLIGKSGVATPANSAIDGRLNFGWS